MSKGAFELSLFSARLITETGKFELPIVQLCQLTNRQSLFFGLRHKSRAKNSQYKCTFIYIILHKIQICLKSSGQFNKKIISK